MMLQCLETPLQMNLSLLSKEKCMYTFECYNTDGTLITVSFDGFGMTWMEIAGKFQDFLSGSGFVIPSSLSFEEVLSDAAEEVFDNSECVQPKRAAPKQAAKFVQ